MNATLEERIFEGIYRHFDFRKRDLLRIVKTEYSFEEWLNWEVYLACSDSGFSCVAPKPRYSRCGAIGSNSLGDVLVEHGPERLLVEIGLVHDGTTDKWLDKLEEDRKKLLQPLAARVTPIHLVICISRGNVCTSPSWTKWLNRLSFWSKPPCFDRVLDLEPGTALFRAWLVQPPQ